MRAVILAVLLLCALAADAAACSCVGRSPVESMASADAAFIGKVTAVRSEEAQGSTPTFVKRVRVYTVAVEKAYKGEVGKTAEVRGEDPDAGSFTSCGVFLEVGDTLGGYFDGPPSEWFIFTCNNASREDLEAGLKGFPDPVGSGDAVALLAGSMGSATFAAVDREGRVIAYAKTASETAFVRLSPCPGGRHVLESTLSGVRTRRLSDLRVVRRLSARYAEVRCLDAGGRTAVAVRGSRTFRLRDGSERTLARRAFAAAPGPVVSIAADRRGRVRIFDSRTGRTRATARVGAKPEAASVSPDGRFVAVRDRGRLTTFSAAGERIAAVRAPGRAGTIAWIGGRAKAVEQAGAAAVAGSLWWAYRGRMHRAALTGGPSQAFGEVPDIQGLGSTVVPLPAPVRVSDATRFNPSASAGSRPRARRARAVQGAPRGDCPRA
jgi:hypothetical protein